MRSFFFDVLLPNVRVADVLDVLFVACLLYVLLRWFTKRSAHGVAAGAAFVLAAYLAARMTEMYLTLEIFRVGLTVILVSLVVVFQQDIRQIFERLSAWRPSWSGGDSKTPEILDVLTESVSKLSEERSGALIVLKGRQPLERHTRGGIPADAVLSMPLLHSIFNRHSQGHDGAVIVDQGRVEAFGTHLPLSKNVDEIGEGGTRHAAALGLSERTDALIVIVSEERGTISVASGSRLTPFTSPAELQQHLETFFARRSTNPDPPSLAARLPQRLALQGLALVIATTLWFLIAFRIEPFTAVYPDVAIEFRKLPEEWRIDQIDPPTVRLTLAGPERAFTRLEPEELSVTLVPKQLREGYSEFTITESVLDLPAGIELQSAEPAAIRVQMHRYVEVSLPIEVQTAGQLPDPLQLVEVKVTPASYPVLLRQSATRIDQLRTEPIDLSEIERSATRSVEIELPEGVLKAKSAPEINVEIKVESR